MSAEYREDKNKSIDFGPSRESYVDSTNSRLMVSLLCEQSNNSNSQDEYGSEPEIRHLGSSFWRIFHAVAGASEDRVGKLALASLEAQYVSRSGLFPEYHEPDISIDECGEISFALSTHRGYLDIGVCGLGEISYHVRNDYEPSMTAFGDKSLKNGLPEDLVESAASMFSGN